MSLGTANRDGGKTSESGHLRAIAKLVTGDVLNGLLVAQRTAGANMSVDISIGDAFLRRSDGSYAHPAFNDAVYNQVIATADGANARRDIVVMYLDYAAPVVQTVSNNTNGVIAIKVVAGTPAGSPVDPTDVAIQASVGSGNPWTKLGRVRVPAAQTSITNTLIDDLRVMTAPITSTGVINQFAGATAPVGWLLCDGAAVLRSTYAALFAITGVLYGVGDGSTTFNLPNFKGRVPVGLDASDTDFNTLGKSAGSKTINIGHTHTKGNTLSTAGGTTGPYVIGSGNETMGILGGVETRPTLQPSITINYIIKT